MAALELKLAKETQEELRFLLRGHRLGRRRGRPPNQQQPDAIRLAYYGDLRKVLADAKRLVDRELVPHLAELVTHEDALRVDARRASDIMRGISADFEASLRTRDLEALATKHAEATSRFQREQLQRQLRAGVGVDIPVRDSTKVLRANRRFAEENDAYIKSIPREYFGQVQKKVLQGISAGRRWEEIAKDIERRYDVSESTARTIARDQVGKLSAQLNRIRQENLGITGYRWRGVLDSRERPEHREREGKYFDWDDPPEDGHPGEPINCRCSAEPDVKGLLASLEE